MLAIAVLCCAVFLAGCSGKADRALVEAPAVGDLYAAELSTFSDYGFTDEDENEIEPAYGLLKVIAVDAADVVVITENAASATRASATSDLRGDPAGIEFDDSERIGISRADLLKAWDDRLLFGVRRP
ncbi:hypothetical protein LDO26_11195 [Luteimonas sp. BDR2-5]|nr:hypothetical protein [Luteimonas sp. BDR2-5]